MSLKRQNLAGPPTRRQWLAAAVPLWSRNLLGAPPVRAAAFQVPVTPPVGGPLFNGVAARSIADPLFASGFVLTGAGDPVAVVSVDWCEIRNDSYDHWRRSIGNAISTSPERVLVSCVHQHDAPYTDRVAQRLLERAGADNRLCDIAFEDDVVASVAGAARKALASQRAITHIGTGQAKVQEVASNRRYVRADGKVSFGRTSATRDPEIRNKPEGLIDPWLKTITLWAGREPVAALSCYSTHPMSYYGKGDVSADFPSIARAARQKQTPGVLQIYASGCSGDTMAGRYNDGNPANRPVLAGRIERAMEEAWRVSRKAPLAAPAFRNATLVLEPRKAPAFARGAQESRLADPSQRFQLRSEAALGLAWLRRLEQNRPIDVPAIELGPAVITLLPAEAFVRYQLWAQRMRPDKFVIALGYGECAPGYIPTADEAAEGYDDHYSWIAFPECETAILRAMGTALAAHAGFRPR